MNDKFEIVKSHKKLTENLSSKIKLARKRSKKKIVTISRVLKIRPEYLISIEENKFEMIPGEIYLKSFIKNYAVFLDVDVSNEINELNNYYKNLNLKKKVSLNRNLTTHNPDLGLLFFLLFFVVCLILIVGELKQNVLLYSIFYGPKFLI